MSDLLTHALHELKMICVGQWDEGLRLCSAEVLYAEQLNVSRSTLRKAFLEMEKEGILRIEGRKKYLRKRPNVDAKPHGSKPMSKNQSFEVFFLELISSRKLSAGDRLSELELSRSSNCTVGTVREVLNKISSTGIITKKPRRNWEVISFTDKNTESINEMRTMIELNGIEIIKNNPNKYLKPFKMILAEHKKLLGQKKLDIPSFRELDKRFHKGFYNLNDNPLISDQFLLMSLMIYSSIQDTKEGHISALLALHQHIAIIEAMINDQWELASATHRMHIEYSSKH